MSLGQGRGAEQEGLSLPGREEKGFRMTLALPAARGGIPGQGSLPFLTALLPLGGERDCSGSSGVWLGSRPGAC